MRVTLSLADHRDREEIYTIRHDVYAAELGQHNINSERRLTDNLDDVNVYLVARTPGGIIGFVSVTPPSAAGYSVDKYFDRGDLPVTFDDGLYEIRLLTVTRAHRGADVAVLLMYGALRYLESAHARTVIGIGRVEVLPLYERAGMLPLGRRVRSGKVTYELMTASVADLRARAGEFEQVLGRLERQVDWQLDGAPFTDDGCYHGGSFFGAIGDEFQTLERRAQVISADVLDAWFDPAPAVVDKIAACLSFALKTSPPTGCDGMRRAIARTRGVSQDSILPGGGSSDLIFAGLQKWVASDARVLILDPMYGEYAHVLENVIGAQVDRLNLLRARQYDVDPDELGAFAGLDYDWIVLVNPNSPTGRHVARAQLEQVIARTPVRTRWWLDETYIDYVGASESLEAFASTSRNVIVCKSMSKAYALSGARAAYLCGAPELIAPLRQHCPPWSVSLVGQMAACEALQNLDYYRNRWTDTHRLRDGLAASLRGLDWDVVPGCANFLLCHLPADQPAAADLVAACRRHDLFIRDVSSMGKSLDRRTLRIAVKNEPTNQRMIDILAGVLQERRGRARAA